MDQQTADELCALLTENRDILCDILEQIGESNQIQKDFLFSITTSPAYNGPKATMIENRIEKNLDLIEQQLTIVKKISEKIITQS